MARSTEEQLKYSSKLALVELLCKLNVANWSWSSLNRMRIGRDIQFLLKTLETELYNSSELETTLLGLQDTIT